MPQYKQQEMQTARLIIKTFFFALIQLKLNAEIASGTGADMFIITADECSV